MRVGCVKEIKNNEYRVGLTPDNVVSYVNAGHEVILKRTQASAQDLPQTSM